MKFYFKQRRDDGIRPRHAGNWNFSISTAAVFWAKTPPVAIPNSHPIKAMVFMNENELAGQAVLIKRKGPAGRHRGLQLREDTR
jgi:hypothetical protein